MYLSLNLVSGVNNYKGPFVKILDVLLHELLKRISSIGMELELLPQKDRLHLYCAYDDTVSREKREIVGISLRNQNRSLFLQRNRQISVSDATEYSTKKKVYEGMLSETHYNEFSVQSIISYCRWINSCISQGSRLS